MSVDDGLRSGQGTTSVQICTGVLVDKVYVISSSRSKSPCWQAGTALAALQLVAPPHRVWI